MMPSRKQAEHAGRVIGVGRLLQQLAADDNNGVGPKNGVVRMPREDSPGFLAGQAPGIVQRTFVGQRRFRDMRRIDDERDGRVAQKLGTSRRSRSKDQHIVPIVSGDAACASSTLSFTSDVR